MRNGIKPRPNRADDPEFQTRLDFRTAPKTYLHRVVPLGSLSEPKINVRTGDSHDPAFEIRDKLRGLHRHIYSREVEAQASRTARGKRVKNTSMLKQLEMMEADYQMQANLPYAEPTEVSGMAIRVSLLLPARFPPRRAAGCP
jgi:hypothetical protein